MTDTLQFDLSRRKLPHFLLVGIQSEFIPDVLDWMEKNALPLVLALPAHITLRQALGNQLMTGQNPNAMVPIVHFYSKAPTLTQDGHRKAFSAWHRGMMAERQAAGSGLVKVTEGQAKAAGIDLDAK